ncbi:MAG: calcium/sodium antiporter [Pseudomonadota bacterium]
MAVSLSLLIIGLVLLLWSADRFVSAASVLAGHWGLSPLLIGMIIVGFGTSAPEMTVSVLSAMQGNPGLALGNAYGSNISNIALILGVTALVSPIRVQSDVVQKQLPLLLLVTVMAGWQLLDGQVSRLEAFVLLAMFGGLLVWNLVQSWRAPADPLVADVDDALDHQHIGLRACYLWLPVSLIILVFSSRLVVTGAVDLAQWFGLSDLVIGLTVVAIGTSLPELASTLVAARRGEQDLALGSVLGSNLFNTLVVIGLAGAVTPLAVDPEVLRRDVPMMLGLTLLLLIFGIGRKGPGRINRIEGATLLVIFVTYTVLLILW